MRLLLGSAVALWQLRSCCGILPCRKDHRCVFRVLCRSRLSDDTGVKDLQPANRSECKALWLGHRLQSWPSCRLSDCSGKILCPSNSWRSLLLRVVCSCFVSLFCWGKCTPLFWIRKRKTKKTINHQRKKTQVPENQHNYFMRVRPKPINAPSPIFAASVWYHFLSWRITTLLMPVTLT